MRRLGKQDGFTLIEVLVAAVILIVGIVAALGAMTASQKLSTVAERNTSIVHRAQEELERVKSLPYSQIGLTGTSASWSSTAGNYTYVGGTGTGACPSTSSGAAPTYQPDHYPGGSTATESLVINGCSYTLNGTTSSFSGGTVAPVTSWSGGGLSGSIYDFITWTADPTCSQTSTPGSTCPTTNDYKRVTVVVTLNGVTEPAKPAIVGAFVVNPSSAPAGVTNSQNPIDNAHTSCQDSSGNTVSCSNTLPGTPLPYFPGDCSYSGSCGTPPCSGNLLHNTIALVGGLLAPAPDKLSSTLPTGQCTDGSGNPQPPCFATDIGCGTGGGLPIIPSGSSTCGSPPTSNSKTHSWVTPDIPAGTSVNLTGAGSMTAYLQSTTGVQVNATLCVALYIVPDSLLGTLAGNLLSQKIGATASATVSAAAAAPTPVSFTFNVGQAATVSSTIQNVCRIEVVVWLAGTGTTAPMTINYDQLNYASQFTLMSQ